jgi:uncharacterized protein (TIGR02594 family)
VINGQPYQVDPPWLLFLRQHDGLAEVPGLTTNPVILQWLRQMRAWWDDDETPWCGVAMDAAFRHAKIDPPKASYRAMSWAEWGSPLVKCIRGCVAVLSRKGGAHVCVVDSIDQRGRIMAWGGNQGNRISLAPFEPIRIVARRWPPGVAYPANPVLPRVQVYHNSSENEA